jgi:hypothetical protein
MDKERKSLIKKLDAISRKLTFIRDKGVCQFCFTYSPDGDCCHIIAKGNGYSRRRWDLLNMIWGCRECHSNQHAGIEGFDIKCKVEAWIINYVEKYKKNTSEKMSKFEMEKLLKAMEYTEDQWNNGRNDKFANFRRASFSGDKK